MSSVDIIKERLNIADVVGGYVKLEKAGANFRARCPFHTEKTPSFFVSPTRNTFHCFGCNKGGDIFTFVEDIEGLDFQGALKLLAERAHVELPKFSKKEAGEEEKLRTILEATTIFFQRNLASERAPLSYVYERGLSRESLSKFRLGFARTGFTELRDYLVGKGFSEADAVRAGVLIKGTRGYHDRFRSRIMFPLTDAVGRVVGFTGRIFGDDDGMGKYVNTPETPLYHKSRLLYGYDHAKTAIRKSETAVLVEGQMDLILAHQSGVENAVAVSGTAFSEHHATMLSRLAKRLVLALDADPAGEKAALRAASMAFAAGVDVLSANLPEGKDPADIAKENGALLKDIIEHGEPIIPALLSRMKSRAGGGELRKLVERDIVPLLAKMENKIEEAHFTNTVSETLGIPAEAVREEVMRTRRGTQTSFAKTLPEEESTEHKEPTRADIIARHIESIILWQQDIPSPRVSISDVRERFKKMLGRDPAQKDEERAFEAEIYFGDKDIGREMESLFAQLSLEQLKQELILKTEELRRAEQEGDSKKANTLLTECANISKQLAAAPLAN